MKINLNLFLVLLFIVAQPTIAQKNKKTNVKATIYNDSLYNGMSWRNIGPFRGGRSTTSSGVVGDPMTYYFGSVGG